MIVEKENENMLDGGFFWWGFGVAHALEKPFARDAGTLAPAWAPW